MRELPDSLACCDSVRTFWLKTAASYQLKLSSGLEANRPRVRKVSARLLVSYKNKYRSSPLTNAKTLMS